jgi:hypothetical protein
MQMKILSNLDKLETVKELESYGLAKGKEGTGSRKMVKKDILTCHLSSNI